MTAGLDTTAIFDAVARIAVGLDGIRDRLNAADRVLGDGDTGMTIATVVRAWWSVPRDAAGDVGATLLALSRATRDASGSSLASVIATALSAAGKSLGGVSRAEPGALVAALAAAERAVTARSGAAEGDKSFLDSLAAIRRALETAGGAASLEVAVRGAEAAMETFRPREAGVGRARMYGAKASGRDDPGMLAAVEMLRAVAASR